MGQRLVVTIKTNEKELAKIYYHWSAYTESALYETKKIIDCIYNHTDETESELLLRLVRFCEDNGGGIDGTDDASEYKYIQSLYPNETFKTEGYSRSNGLIALSEKNMVEMQSWSEGDVFINIDTDEVDFHVYCSYDNIADYFDERKEWDDDFNEDDFKNIPEFDFDLYHFDTKDIDSIITQIDNSGHNDIIICNGEVCDFIA